MTPSIAIKKKRYLVVVADEYQAILYEREGLNGPLRQLHTLTNKEGGIDKATRIREAFEYNNEITKDLLRFRRSQNEVLGVKAPPRNNATTNTPQAA